MKKDATEAQRPSWEAVVLVCKDCGKRSNGPDGLKAKAVMHEVKRSLGGLKPRPRTVLTSCLGLCPKRAMAVAGAGNGGEARIIALTSLDQVADAMPQLLGTPPRNN